MGLFWFRNSGGRSRISKKHGLMDMFLWPQKIGPKKKWLEGNRPHINLDQVTWGSKGNLARMRPKYVRFCCSSNALGPGKCRESREISTYTARQRSLCMYIYTYIQYIHLYIYIIYYILILNIIKWCTRLREQTRQYFPAIKRGNWKSPI